MNETQYISDFLAPRDAWDKLSIEEQAAMMKTAVSEGILDLGTIRQKYNEFAEGGNTDDDLVDWIIREEGFIANPRDIGDGKMTLGSGLTAQKWHDQYKRNGNKWTSSDNRRAVREEVANRRRWAEKNIPNWDSLPSSSQKALLSYKYNYDFNRTNSPKLFKALSDSNLQEAARQMDATSSNPIFKKGLQDRRQREQEWFLQDVATSQPADIAYQPAVSTQVYNPYVQQVETTRTLPIDEPDPNSYIRTREVSPQEQRRRKFQENVEAFQRFNALMNLIDLRNNPAPSYNPIYSLIGGDSDEYANGGKIHIKPENRGKFTALKERTGHSATWFKEHGTPAQKKMAVFALNSRHWKHGLGGNLFDGTTESSQKMQVGLKATNGWKPYTLDDILANAARIEQQKQAMEDTLNNVFTLSNDATSVANGRSQNRHLERKAIEGARAHRAWEEEHPHTTIAGNILGAAPLAIAAIPATGAAVESLPTVASALAPGSTFWMNPITQQVTASTLGGKVVDLATTALTPYDSWGEGVSDVVNQTTGWNPEDSWWGSILADMTNPGYLTPYGLIEKSTNKTLQASSSFLENHPALYQYPRYAIGKLKYGFDANLPTVYRKIGEIPTISNGKVRISPIENRFAFKQGTGEESPLITNMSTDVAVREHPDGSWNHQMILSFPGKSLLGKKVISTRPSDTFVYGDILNVPTKKVKVISGNKAELDFFNNKSIETITSPHLQSTYSADRSKYAIEKFVKGKEPLSSFKNYAKEQQEILRKNFNSPSIKDYQFMDYVFNPQYNSQATPAIDTSNISIKFLNEHPIFGEWFGNSYRRNLLTDKNEWDKVMYDPASPVESEFRSTLEIDLKPQYKIKK